MDAEPSRDERTRAQPRIRDLAVRFHRASTAVRIPFRDRLRYWVGYVGLARRGQMVFSASRDAQYVDGFWRRRYERACARINDRLGRAQPAATVDVPCFLPGELQRADLALLMRMQVPFLIRDGARGLGVAKWSLDYLEQVAGDCQVPVNEAGDRPSADASLPTKAHHYYDFHTGTLAEVVAAIRRGGNARTTTAEDVMHHAGARLRQDLDIAFFERLSGWDRNRHHWLRSRLQVGRIVGAQLLVQPENAFTLWHAEPGDNFFVLARGHKTWTLAHPFYTAALQPRVKSTTNYHGSNIDIREPDDVLRQRGFAGYLGMPKVRAELQPGDILRVPNHWWHTVVTRPGGYTVGVSVRAIGSFNLVCPGYTFLRLRDRQFHELARAFARDGRIHDGVIGYPRKSRAVTRERDGAAVR